MQKKKNLQDADVSKKIKKVEWKRQPKNKQKCQQKLKKKKNQKAFYFVTVFLLLFFIYLFNKELWDYFNV